MCANRFSLPLPKKLGNFQCPNQFPNQCPFLFRKNERKSVSKCRLMSSWPLSNCYSRMILQYTTSANETKHPNYTWMLTSSDFRTICKWIGSMTAALDDSYYAIIMSNRISDYSFSSVSPPSSSFRIPKYIRRMCMGAIERIRFGLKKRILAMRSAWCVYAVLPGSKCAFV